MPDRSEPRYKQILGELEDQRRAQIGGAHYYIKYDRDWCALCKITPGGREIFFHEIVEHTKYGISEEDIEESVKLDIGIFSLPGHYHISPVIEKKLRALFDTE
ncbi:MAG: hypothetical protein ABFC24_09220 [Methanoregulaceae archaeon]